MRNGGAACPSLRVLDGARLADHGHLDLAGVCQRLLDLAHDVACQAGRSEIVDLLRPDKDAHLAPGLDGERLLDALEAVGDGLQLLESLEVGLSRLAPGARPRG